MTSPGLLSRAAGGNGQSAVSARNCEQPGRAIRGNGAFIRCPWWAPSAINEPGQPVRALRPASWQPTPPRHGASQATSIVSVVEAVYSPRARAPGTAFMLEVVLCRLLPAREGDRLSEEARP